MEIVIWTKWTWTKGADIHINCPACKATNGLAATQQTEEKNYLFRLIPLFSAIYTKITCSKCAKSFKIHRPLAEVLSLDPVGIDKELATEIEFLAKFCVVSSLVFFMIPIVGLVFGLIGFVGTVKKQSRWKRAAQIGLGLALLFSCVMVISIVVSCK